MDTAAIMQSALLGVTEHLPVVDCSAGRERAGRSACGVRGLGEPDGVES